MGLIRFIVPYRKQFTLGSFAKLAEAVFELYLPILMARIIDVGIPDGDRAFILRTGLSILFFALLGLGCATTCQYFAAVTSQGSGTNIRNALMEKISAFSYRELDRFGVTTLVNRLTSDVNYVQQAVAMTMRLVTRAPFICIGAVVMSIGIDSRLSVIFGIVIPVLVVIVAVLMRITSGLYKLVQRRLDQFALIVRENLTGIRVIRAFARTGQEQARASSASNALSDAYIKVAGLSALLSPLTSAVLNIGIIAILYYGAGRVYDGYLTQGDLLALTIYATKILYALLVIANLVVLFTKAAASSARITEVLDTEPTITSGAHTAPEAVAGAPLVSFDDVSFSYSGGKSAVMGLSFTAEKGHTVGIIGATGSGKSTLINLLQRLYDPDQGQVLLNGNSLRQYPIDSLRARIGVAPQQSTLFTGSIAENIRFAKRDATDAEVVSALKIAQCWEFVSRLPDGMDSPIQEGGKNLSGGQRQRINIARAIVGSPEIVILDDCLSALDYQTDYRLRQALAEHMAGSTVFIVSQRVSSVVSADTIIVLADGCMQGMGAHAQLLETCTTYREIYETQTENYHEGA